jgi:predicted alpha/beta superfamily hydrolase
MRLDAMSLPAEAPVTLLGAIQFDLASRASGRTYRIAIYEPPGPPPERGWPMVLLTDGNLTFPIASALAGFLAFGGEPALIVGVGYPTRDPRELARRRFRDLTAPTPLERVAWRPGLPRLAACDLGADAEFRRFLTDELRPRIAAAFPLDAET